MIPNIIFIIPYRNRPQHKFFFSNYLQTIMEKQDNYEVYFAHQCDIRAFNRGATKNIGFLAIKKKYPDDYKNMTFVFNDIDTIPFSNIFNYNTVPGIVKHFYGFNYALGGIVAFNGSDFEKTNGFPNYWGWGMEDTVLQQRCQNIGLQIDRSQFYEIGSPNILHLFDGIKRIINPKDPLRATNDNGVDGIKTIHKLQYSIDSESKNHLDNIHTICDNKFFIINITTFMTGIKFEQDNYIKYDLREPSKNVIHSKNTNTYNVDHMVNDWTNISYQPTQEQEQTHNKYKNKSIQQVKQQQPQQQPQQQQQQQQMILNNITQYNEFMKHKITHAKAHKSANIRLGGIY
jgi:hypothetical protein